MRLEISEIIGIVVIILISALLGYIPTRAQEILDLENDTSSLMLVPELPKPIPFETQIADLKRRLNYQNTIASKYAKLYEECRSNSDDTFVVTLSQLRSLRNK